MKEQMSLYYDAEADFLEIGFSEGKETFVRDIGKGISERIDEETGKVVGILVMGFKKKTGSLKDLKLKLPVKVEVSG